MKKKKPEIEVGDSLEDLLGSEAETKKSPQNLTPSKINSGNRFAQPVNSEIKKSLENNSEVPEDSTIIDLEDQTTSDSTDDLANTEQRFGMVHIDNVSSEGYIQCPPAIKLIPIQHRAYEELILQAKAINEIGREKFGEDSEKLETYCYLFCDPEEFPDDKPACVSSVYIPYHQAGETNVHVDEEGMLDIQRYIRKTGKVLLGWAHSHGHFEVFSSQTDDLNHQIILNETNNYLVQNKFRLKYMYSITVVESAENYGVVLTQYPCGHTEQSKAEVKLVGDPYLPEESKEKYQEIKKLLEERARLFRPSQSKSLETLINDLNDELLADFVHQIWKAKSLVIEQIPTEKEAQFDLIEEMIQKYDKLLIAGAEESFRAIAKKITDVMQRTSKEL